MWVVLPTGPRGLLDYWLLCDHRDGQPPPVVHEAATFEAELQAVASGRGISITTAARYYTRPGLAFPVITDAPWCTVAIAQSPQPQPTARHFAHLTQHIISATTAAPTD